LLILSLVSFYFTVWGKNNYLLILFFAGFMWYMNHT
jgi:hypothetical protein